MSIQPAVYVIDDDIVSHDAICALVESMGLKPCRYRTVESFLEDCGGFAPGCIVSGLRMAGLGGLQLQQEVAKRRIALPIIFVTGYPDVTMAVHAMKNGAVNVLEKPFRSQELWDAIQAALRQNEQMRARECRRKCVEERLARLNQNEHEVLKLIIDGVPNKAIARRHEVSIRTIEARRRNVFRKTGAASLPELVRLVIESEQTALGLQVSQVN